jgi:cation diffusion facilitator family transporter
VSGLVSFLVRHFVKDYLATDREKVRTAYGVLASVVGILCNILLFAVKAGIGLLLNSISVIADAANNLSDAGASVISLFGVKMAEKPADKEHPFGHGRLEYISALVVAFLILVVGLSLLKRSFEKVINPEPVGFNLIMVLVLIITVLVKIWLSGFYRKLGKTINSTLLKATSADARNDVIVTSATIASIIIGGIVNIPIDGWIGLAVSGFVLFSGIRIAGLTVMPLLGEAVGKDIYDAITQKVLSYEGIIGSHDLILHNYGPSHIMATIHAEVPNTSDIQTSHEIIDRIEREVHTEMGISLLVHMDPVEVNDEKILESKNMVEKVVGILEPDAAIHDFRVISGENHSNLIFDLVVPYSYKTKEGRILAEKIMALVGEINGKYHCVITMEYSYIAK